MQSCCQNDKLKTVNKKITRWYIAKDLFLQPIGNDGKTVLFFLIWNVNIVHFDKVVLELFYEQLKWVFVW